MRARTNLLEGLLELPRYGDRTVRRGAFRQSIAALAIDASLDGPSPLDGLNPEALLRSIKTALSDGLLDDLGWLAPAAAGVALYEIASALPLGPERRDLGRRVLGQLYEGNAATFVAIATRMAAGAARGLAGAGVRARVALSVALPMSSDVRVGPLALALASRRELARDWIGASATGSLPERRLAARLLERAAREAARRSSQGDDQALRLFRGMSSSAGRGPAEIIAGVWQGLLADRETLVWRHVAFARGLLAGVLPEMRVQIDKMLAPDLSPTEWRRGATSLAASIAADPEGALERARTLLAGPLITKDPGIATALLWGILPAADAEPEAAEELLDAIVAVAPIAVAESLVDLRLELGRDAPRPGSAKFGARAAEACARAIQSSLHLPEPDDGLAALARSILRDLGPGDGRELVTAIRNAVDAFVESGTREAHARARQALAIVSDTMGALEALDVDDEEGPQSSMSRRAAVDLLRDLDVTLLESGSLKSLLLLDRRIGEEVGGVAPIDDLDERLTTWLLEKQSGNASAERPAVHVTLHLRQLRALLHLIDGETTDFGEDQERRLRVRARWTTACRTLLRRVVVERGSPLRRALAATLARAFDALVRDGAADGADVLLHAAMKLSDPADIAVLAEASMHPDVNQVLSLYAAFAGGAGPHALDDASRPLARLAALKGFVAEVPADATERTQAARNALSRLTRALEAVETSVALTTLVPEQTATEAAPLAALEDSLAQLAKLTTAAHRRCGDSADADPASRPAAYALELAVERVVQSGDAGEDLKRAIMVTTQLAYETIPLAVAEVVSLVLPRLATLPVDRPSVVVKRPMSDYPLPNWVPTRRMLGGFYVHGQLGGGAAGTVFVVSRAEERHDPGAERFALKVPDYDATAARSLSEADFSRMFREEAGALLSMPEHPNLARFVTFDAGAKPKPVLVMELVEGVRCDTIISSRGLTVERAVSLLDGVLAGLEAMHGVGVGHLDVKPSNVILRAGKEPVLVDFGLAGRHLRPGCATGCYGAPEVWGIESREATPLTADVYSFGCLAYEVFTARTLFDAPSEVALVSAHLTHDGLPPPVKRMAASETLQPLAMLLHQCLRHDPAHRATVRALRKELARVATLLGTQAWPVVGSPASS